MSQRFLSVGFNRGKPRNWKTSYSVLNFKLAVALTPCTILRQCPPQSKHIIQAKLDNKRKNIIKHYITRLPPELFVAGKSPLSSSRNPFDSAINLSLHPYFHMRKWTPKTSFKFSLSHCMVKVSNNWHPLVHVAPHTHTNNIHCC